MEASQDRTENRTESIIAIREILEATKIQLKQNTPEQIIIKIKYAFNHTIAIQQFLQKDILIWIESWNQQGLFIVNTNNVQIVKDISHIDMHYVKHLTLFDHQITSIQPLCWMKLINLQTLNLSNNNISSLQPLAKTKFTNIKKLMLGLNYNKYISIDQVEKLKFMHEKLYFSRDEGLDLSKRIEMRWIIFKLESAKAFNIETDNQIVSSQKYANALVQKLKNT